jgi:chromate reductase
VDAVLICTPEYAGGLPGSFKNLLDWTVGGGEVYGKPVAWINASSVAAPTGGADAHESLRKVLTYAGADIVDAACARIPVSRTDVDETGRISDDGLRAKIGAAVAELVAAVN